MANGSWADAQYSATLRGADGMGDQNDGFLFAAAGE
jgi:hypothetical protein